MKFIAEDPRCSEGTVIRDLLDLVRKRLLVVKAKMLEPGQEECEDYEYCAYSKESEKWVRAIVKKVTPDYLCKPEVWTRHKNASCPRETS